MSVGDDGMSGFEGVLSTFPYIGLASAVVTIFLVLYGTAGRGMWMTVLALGLLGSIALGATAVASRRYEAPWVRVRFTVWSITIVFWVYALVANALV